MATCGTGIQAKLDPRNVWFGRNETYCIETVADSSGSLNNKYWLLERVNGTQYHVWYNVNAAGVDPSPGSSLPIEVALDTNDTAAAVATKTAAAIETGLGTDFYSEANSGEFIVVSKPYGKITNEAADGDTGFTFTTALAGSYESLGKTSAPITFTPDVTTLEVRSDQNGETLEDELITGFAVVIASSFQELTKARLLDIIGNGEGSELLDGWGYGTGKVGSSRFSTAGTLFLLSDKGEDPLVMWKTVADLNGLNFSGVEQQVGELEFRAYVDNTKQDAINLSYAGDYTQDGLWK